MAYLEYTKRNGKVIRISAFAITVIYIAFAILVIVFLTWTHDNDKEAYEQQFLYEFNTTVNPELQQDDVKTVKSIAPGYYFEASEWASIWNFADKYDITEFPKYNGNIYTQQDLSRNLLAQLEAADEYIETNHIDKTTASRLLNQAFATANGSLVTVLQTGK